MMKRNVLVGLFVIAALSLFTIGLFLIGNRHEAFARHVEYYAEFTNLSGLTKGGKVQVAGMDAGQIVQIAIPNSPTGRFRLRIRIDDALHGLVRTDSVATISTEGVVGDTFLLIRPGSAGAEAALAGATLPSKEPIDLSDLLDQGKGTLTDVDNTVRNASGLLSSVGGNLNATLAVAKTTIANANDVVTGIKAGRGPAGMILRDDALAGQIRQAVTNAQTATAQLSQASTQVNSLVSDVQSRQLPRKVDDTLASVKNAAANLDAGSGQIRQTIAEATAPDRQGVTAGVNVRESLSNANAATANMADDTEALKHNLLVRGFFRHRGYYNLSGISPEEYRRDSKFTARSSERTWISAEKLFVTDSRGMEQLTDEGKSLLDTLAGKYGDALMENPIVVEGYEDGPDASEQLARSRNRALLVRHYLVGHLQMDASQIGVVAMKGLPPAGLDRSTWNGVCLVLLRPKP